MAKMNKTGLYITLAGMILGAVPVSAGETALPPSPDLPVLLQRANAAADNLQLGELALENNDDSGAIDFLQYALRGQLNDVKLTRRAVNHLHGCYLRRNQVAEAESLLKQPDVQAALQGDELLQKLLQIRTASYYRNSQKVITLSRDLTLNDQVGDKTACEIIEARARAFQRLGDYDNALKSFERLLKIAGSDGRLRLIALDGIILNSLAVGNTARAEQACAELDKSVPEDFRQRFAERIQHLNWLSSCYAGKFDQVRKAFDLAVINPAAPSPLASRIAMQLGNHCAGSKQYAPAGKYYRLAFRLAEEKFRQIALRAIVENDLAAGDWAEALKNTELYLKSYPQAVDHNIMALLKAHLHNQLKNVKQAEADYAALQQNNNVAISIRYAAALELIRIYKKSNNAKDTEIQFRFAIEHAPDLNQKNTLRQLLGEYFYQLSKYPEAAACFAEAAEAGSKRSSFWLAQTCFQQKGYTRAEQVLKKVKDYEDADLQRRADYLHALIIEKLYDTDHAIAGYLEFAQRYPKAPEAESAIFQAGVLARGSQRYHGHEIFRKYAQHYPGEARSANALYRALTELLMLGNGAEADKLFSELNRLYGSSKYTVSAYFFMVDFFLRNKNYDRAGQLLNELEKRYSSKHPELVPEILYDRAVLCGELKEYDKMLHALEEITLQYSTHKVAPQAFFLLGDLKMAYGDYKAALTAFQQAHERSGGGIFAFCCLGRSADAAFAIYSSGNGIQYLRQATDGYENLLKINELPAELYVQTLYNYGRCLSEGGNKAKALYCYRKLLYEALTAKRGARFYSPVWSAKALDAAIKLLGAEIRQESSPQQAEKLRKEADYLLQIGEALELPHEDIKSRRKALSEIRYQEK